MQWFFDRVSALTAGLLELGLMVGALVGASYLGVWLAGLTRRNWVGWFAGITTFILLVVILTPISGALKEVQCKGASNFEDCLNDEGDYAPSDY